MGFFDDFTNVILAIVALVVVVAAFETSWLVWRAKKKRERQDKAHSNDV